MSPGPGTRILRWFRGAPRELPWRGPFPRDPYRVLVAEVMLQQTQVERMAEPYSRLIERFPTLEALAAADPEDVLHAFSGLGYYRRARALHAAARAIVERGSWPETPLALAELPGFGPYTSAALAAFSFGGTEPPVDGNVSRVAARLGALALPMGSAALLAAGRELGLALHSETRTPECWEALMELGATVCTPAAPRCDVCPVASACAGLATGDVLAFPLPRPQRARESQTWSAVWLARDDGRVLLARVDEGKLLGGMWLPPFLVLRDGHEAHGAARRLAREAGFAVGLRPAPSVRHAITHRDILVLPFIGAIPGARVAEPRPGWRWEDAAAPSVPTPSLLTKLARACAPRGPED